MASNSIIRSWLRDLRIGLIFMTRLPVRQREEIDGVALARSTRANPLVGALVGGAGALAFWVAISLGLTPWIAALLALTATLLLTGALHEDGLADLADGLGGGSDRQRKLEIMRDSRIGSYGGAALFLTLGLRGGAVAALAEPGLVAAALIAAHGAARGYLPLFMNKTPLARSEGLAASVAAPTAATAYTALGMSLLLCVLCLGIADGALAFVSAGAAVWLLRAVARRQIGGYTGDVLGAAEQIAEIVLLLTLVGLQ